ncbi:MAG: MerR family transcriptional regulator [Elusimicrobia bacterium]|nr:MerR family transcriptional regulator [Candidatus Liberimonas magnetica]
MATIEPLIPANKEFFSIGEVTRIAQVPAYVLRYWESEFKILRPARRNSGQRKYTRKDIEMISRIKDLLYEKKFTIAGARKEIFKDKRKKEPLQLNFISDNPNLDMKTVSEAVKELEDILIILKE